MTNDQFTLLYGEFKAFRKETNDALTLQSQKFIEEMRLNALDRTQLAVLIARIPMVDTLQVRVNALERSWAKFVGFAAGGGFLGAGTVAGLWRLIGWE